MDDFRLALVLIFSKVGAGGIAEVAAASAGGLSMWNRVYSAMPRYTPAHPGVQGYEVIFRLTRECPGIARYTYPDISGNAAGAKPDVSYQI